MPAMPAQLRSTMFDPATQRYTIKTDDGQVWQGSRQEFQAWMRAYSRAKLEAFEHQWRQRMSEPESDDIQDPAVPASVKALTATDEIIKAIPPELNISEMRDRILLIAHETFTSFQDEARAALSKLALPSEEARVTCRDPHGFFVTFITRKNTASEMIEATQKMTAWLAENGYTTNGM